MIKIYYNRKLPYIKDSTLKERTKHIGKNNGRYIDGRTLKKYYCKKCNKKINLNTGIYGTGLCNKCKNQMLFKDKKRKFSEKHKQHMRKKRPSISGRKNPNFGGKCHSKKNSYKGGYYKGIWMRSSYEIIYAKWLDKNKIKWKYEYKTFDLGYTTYIPDFYLPKRNRYIEIKGYWRDDARKKVKLFRKLYSNIKLSVIISTEIKRIKKDLRIENEN